MSVNVNNGKPSRLRPRAWRMTRIYRDIHGERLRAHAKHDGNGDSMERLPWDDAAWLPVLTEEIGEVARVICDIRHGKYTAAATLARRHMRDELIQVAAMATAWVEAIDAEGH